MSGMRSEKIRKSARGQLCQARIPGVCNYDPRTTVFAHLNGYGIGGKNPDLFGAFCCSDCHRYIDSDYDQETLIMFYEAIFRTQRILLEIGLIKI